MKNTIIAYDKDNREIFTFVTTKTKKLGDTIDGKIVYAIVSNDAAAYIDTKVRDKKDAEWQTIAYHSSEYNAAVKKPEYIEYRKRGETWYLHNGDTEDFYERYKRNLVKYIVDGLVCLLQHEETRTQVNGLNRYDGGYTNKAIRNGEVVYTEWMQR